MLKSLIIEGYDGKTFYQEDLELHVSVEVDKKYQGDLKDNNYVYTLSVVVRKKGSKKEYQGVVYTLDKKDDMHVTVRNRGGFEFGESYITYITGKIDGKVKYLFEVANDEDEENFVDHWVEDSFGRVSYYIVDEEVKTKEKVEMVGKVPNNEINI